jgi:hypothetical protein
MLIIFTRISFLWNMILQNTSRKSEPFMTSSHCLTRIYFQLLYILSDRLCGLVVRVLGYRSGGPDSVPGTTRKKIREVGLERGPLSLVSTTEELLDRKVAAPVLKTENTAY